MKSVAAGRAVWIAAPSDYLALTKPRVVALILVTTAVGFVMGGREALAGIDLALLARTLLGTALVAAGTLALNQLLEKELDARMRRTSSRPLPAGRMQPIEALAFGALLAGSGLIYLTFAVNPVSGLATALTVITYLFCYTPLKTRTPLCSLAGAFPGALPPVTGWAAATGGELGAGAAVLFGILFFWQLPHSLAIAHLYREDYERAGMRLLAGVDPDGASSGRHAAANSLILLAVGMLPTLIGMAGWVTFLTALLFGGLVVWQAAGLAIVRTPARARSLLAATYAYVPAVLGVMALERMAGR